MRSSEETFKAQMEKKAKASLSPQSLTPIFHALQDYAINAQGELAGLDVVFREITPSVVSMHVHYRPTAAVEYKGIEVAPLKLEAQGVIGYVTKVNPDIHSLDGIITETASAGSLHSLIHTINALENLGGEEHAMLAGFKNDLVEAAAKYLEWGEVGGLSRHIEGGVEKVHAQTLGINQPPITTAQSFSELVTNALKTAISSNAFLQTQDATSFVESLYEQLYERFSELKQTPLVVSSDQAYTAQELLLSRLYTAYPEMARSHLLQVMEKADSHPFIVKDLLHYFSLGIAQGEQFPNNGGVPMHVLKEDGSFAVTRHEPFRMVFQETITPSGCAANTKQDPGNEVGGYYSREYNVMTFASDVAWVHEATHALMADLYDHGTKPYPQGDSLVKEHFHQAKMQIMQFLAGKLGVNSTEYKDIDALQYAIKNDSLLPLLQMIKDERSIEDIQFFLRTNAAVKNLLDPLEIAVEQIKTDGLNYLHLTESEGKWAQVMIELLFTYQESYFDDELIAHYAHLRYQGVDVPAFSGMESYWEQHIHTRVAHQAEHYHSICSQAMCSATPLMAEAFDSGFEHCVVLEFA